MGARASGARWRKASAERVAQFEAVIVREERAELRRMFGYPAAFVNGNMATGLHQEDWMVRLGEADRAKLLAAGGRPFEPMPGRPMREYVVLPEAVVADSRALARWVRRGVEYAAALPRKGAPKAKANAKPRAAKKK